MSAMTGVRELTAAERQAYHTANLLAYERMWYFADALFSVVAVAAPGLETVAVDKHWRLYIDPAVLLGPQAWSVDEMATALLHEVGHLLRDHHGRASAMAQPVGQQAWNYAGDAEINDDLLDAGLVFPVVPVTPAALGQQPGGFAEDYYAAIAADAAAAASQEADQPEAGCGSGSGCDPIPGELGGADVIAGRGGLDPASGEAIRQQVAEAISVAGAGRGDVPAGMRRWAATVLAPPVAPWTRLLRVAVRRAVADAAGCSDYSLRRPSRRSRDVLLPGLRGPRVGVAVVVDTSGSMNSEDLSAALSEVNGVLRCAGVARERLQVLTVDAAASAPQRVSRVQDIVLVGGGGTDMRVGIDAAQGLRPAPDVVVVCTDGDTPWPTQPGRAKLVCVVIGNESAVAHTPPFAVTVAVPSGAGRL